jgi:hypothetical protein
MANGSLISNMKGKSGQLLIYYGRFHDFLFYSFTYLYLTESNCFRCTSSRREGFQCRCTRVLSAAVAGLLAFT